MRVQAPVAAGTAVNTSLLHWVPAVGYSVADRHNHKLDGAVNRVDDVPGCLQADYASVGTLWLLSFLLFFLLVFFHNSFFLEISKQKIIINYNYQEINGKIWGLIMP